jgi:hypothetical protein
MELEEMPQERERELQVQISSVSTWPARRRPRLRETLKMKPQDPNVETDLAPAITASLNMTGPADLDAVLRYQPI